MKRFLLLAATAGLLWNCSRLAAQEKGNWRAASNTAVSITGDLSISDTKVSINYISFTIAQIRHLEPAEVSAVFPSEGINGQGGTFYRLNIPANQRFIRHNTLCGSEDTQWMVTSASGKTLHVAFFSGANTPVLTPEAINNSTDLCGTYTYVR